MNNLENDPHDIPIDDHVDEDILIECGYCGHVFQGLESRIEKTIYGRKWVFCSDECLENFKDASNFKDQDLDGYKREKDDDTFEMNISFTGPED